MCVFSEARLFMGRMGSRELVSGVIDNGKDADIQDIEREGGEKERW